MRRISLNTNATPAARQNYGIPVAATPRVIAEAPYVEDTAPFEPFAIAVETESEARNLGVALRNHQRYIGRPTTARSLVSLCTILQGIDGIDMTVRADSEGE